MKWRDYISSLLASEKSFSNLSISIDAGVTTTSVPPIIRSSIKMLDKMIEKQGRLNVIVFPERVQSIFIFTLMKLFHNISVGKIKSNYDPKEFVAGEKLKVGNSIVEYLGMSEVNGKQYLDIRLADRDRFSAPLSNLPIFQRVSTQRNLSRYSQFNSARNKAIQEMENKCGSEELAYMVDMKTHMDSTIYTMTSVAGVKEQLKRCTIDGKQITKVFYIGQVDYEGKIHNVSPGQMSGVPAIAFASDLYAINEAAKNNYPIQSIIIDGSNSRALIEQLDALDRLVGLGVPIVCITDIANSFELENFATRGFNIWRWDKKSITDQLYNAVPLALDKKTYNYVKQEIEYLNAGGDDINVAIKCLSKHRNKIESLSAQMMKLYEKLNGLSFAALRAMMPIPSVEKYMAHGTIEECRSILDKERKYISDDITICFEKAMDSLEKVYSEGCSFEKIKVLQDYIKKRKTKNYILIISERSAKSQIQDFWDSWCEKHHIKARVKVMFPEEYYSGQIDENAATIVCGWLKRAIMRKIIYGFNTKTYCVLLYNYEERWKKYDLSRWERVLDSSQNKDIIIKSFSAGKNSISTNEYNVKNNTIEKRKVPDELGEIERTVQRNRYRKYTSSEEQTLNERVSAIPVSFVGGYLAFYRKGHEVVSATRIILSDSNNIDTKYPTELKVGDFIVVRATDKELVREIADNILSDSKKKRTIASKWKEAIDIELLFCTVDELCKRIKNGGCDKGNATIKRWIESEDVIAPGTKEDIEIIAKVTENELLQEICEKVYAAAQDVRNAHKMAGKKISEQLKETLARKLKNYENIDPFNFWEPFDLELEGVGNAKVLKIIDIGEEIQIDRSNTNRLIEE